MADVTAKSKRDDIWKAYQQAVKKIRELEALLVVPDGYHEANDRANEIATKLAAYIAALGKVETLNDRYEAEALWRELEALVEQ